MVYDRETGNRVKRHMEATHGVKFRLYKCETCKMWHVTSQPEKENFRRELLD